MLTDKSILDFGAKNYRDVLTTQRARVWVGSFVMQWPNKRIAQALGITTMTVRSTLGVVRKIIEANPEIAYRSIEDHEEE